MEVVIPVFIVLYLVTVLAQWWDSRKPPSERHCPVCGYYCLGKGGIGCIDKPGDIHEP